MLNRVSSVFSCKKCAEFWKLKTVAVLILGIVIGLYGLQFVPITPAAELARTNTTTTFIAK